MFEGALEEMKKILLMNLSFLHNHYHESNSTDGSAERVGTHLLSISHMDYLLSWSSSPGLETADSEVRMLLGLEDDDVLSSDTSRAGAFEGLPLARARLADLTAFFPAGLDISTMKGRKSVEGGLNVDIDLLDSVVLSTLEHGLDPVTRDATVLSSHAALAARLVPLLGNIWHASPALMCVASLLGSEHDRIELNLVHDLLLAGSSSIAGSGGCNEGE